MIQSFMLGAFGGENVGRLTGLSAAQLKRWRQEGLVYPEYSLVDAAGRPTRHIYSFRDLLKLRVLNHLRTAHGAPMPELCRVACELAGLSDEDWRTRNLWVGRGTVGLDGPDGGEMATIALEAMMRAVRQDIESLNRRDASQIGVIIKKRLIQSRRPVFSGTRIPVAGILGYITAGYADDEILPGFPDLVAADLDAARAWGKAAG